MHRNFEEITKEVIELPNIDRLKLVKTLLLLDNEPSDIGVDILWQQEITKPAFAVKNENTVGIDFNDSIQAISNRLST